MKKKYLPLIALLCSVNFSYAQSPIYTTAGYGASYSTDGAYVGWNISGGGGETNFVNNIGLGGIGGFTFDNTTRINATTRLMTILANGNVGIGTPNPGTTLHIQNAATNYASTITLKNTFNGIASRAGLTMENDAGNQTMFYKQASGNADANDVILYSAQGDTRVYTGGIERFRISNSGRVGIKAYVGKNHHLPEIPSAEQMVRDGLNLGELNMLLLKKVEELTLYFIEKDDEDMRKKEELNYQRQELNKQKEATQSLQKEIDELKKQISILIKTK